MIDWDEHVINRSFQHPGSRVEMSVACLLSKEVPSNREAEAQSKVQPYPLSCVIMG